MTAIDVQTLFEAIDGSRSVAQVRLDGVNPHGVTINHISDITYDVLYGQVIFALNGTRHPLRSGESITVRAGMPYSDYGHEAVMLAFCEPAFDPDKVTAS